MEGPKLFSWIFGDKRRRKVHSTNRVHIDKRFALHHEFGQGSMSKVWRATDRKTGRTVCLKVLDKLKTERLLKRFVGRDRPDEGEVAVQMSHPNVIRTFEHGVTAKGEQFLVMELVEGVTLAALIQTRGPELAGRELELLVQAGEGLAHVHEKGFIHRDICPRNFLTTRDGRVKLIDFGLAVPNTPAFRRPGNRTGTVRYMAPELIRRAPTDERIDVFSFGIVAYESLTGDMPWKAAESLHAMMDHMNSPGRDPRELVPHLDARLSQVLMRAIERNPADRYPSMKDFLADLRACAGLEARETVIEES